MKYVCASVCVRARANDRFIVKLLLVHPCATTTAATTATTTTTVGQQDVVFDVRLREMKTDRLQACASARSSAAAQRNAITIQQLYFRRPPEKANRGGAHQ